MPEQQTTVTTVADGVARIAWTADEHVDIVRHELATALLHHSRVEALIDPDDTVSQRTATWAGMRREGIRRGVAVPDEPEAPGPVLADRVVYARLATDIGVDEPGGFRALLNSFLPRKRAIGQLLVRDRDDRVLMCELTYKSDWDLPGGVVEVDESPALAVAREIEEELALDLPAGDLLLADWLPAWGGWDDAVCLVFDGGVHDPRMLDDIVPEPREIRAARFCTAEQIRAQAADFTARRVEAALAALRGDGPNYTESGRTTRG